jgi:hypothetical protein
MKLPTTSVNSATRFSGRSECVVLSCEVSDSRGAAASRLLFRFTLDPMPGLRASNPVFCGATSFRFLQVNP